MLDRLTDLFPSFTVCPDNTFYVHGRPLSVFWPTDPRRFVNVFDRDDHAYLEFNQGNVVVGRRTIVGDTESAACETQVKAAVSWFLIPWS
jgi:hypothetical protein